MLFHTLRYAIFLLAVLLLYHRLRHRGQNVFLLAASYFFYGCWDVRFLALILVSTTTDFLMGRVIASARSSSRFALARAALVMSLTVDLGILGFFKYFDFFAWGAQRMLTTVGLHASLPTLHVILPVGISFYTFQALSYTIDVYRGRLGACDDFVDFALYVSFFPQLVAGPIERAEHLLPQVRGARHVSAADVREGTYLILVGLLRKMVIADTAGVIADLSFGDPSQQNSLQLVRGLVLYTLQIYGDFSGYSNIARGSARLLGFNLMRNFRHPYFSANIAEFWHRWHISLSTWLRDYLYIPLGGNRRGLPRTYANLMVTMLLGGLWHGAHWTFVVWGGLHGVYLVVYRMIHDWRKATGRVLSTANARTAHAIGGLSTFLLVMMTWLPFRINNLGDMKRYVRGMAALTPGSIADVIPLLLLVALWLAIDVPQALADDEYVFIKCRRPTRTLLATTAVTLLILCSGAKDSPFIYFQF